jgi:hypothetical protein
MAAWKKAFWAAARAASGRGWGAVGFGKPGRIGVAIGPSEYG